MTHLIASLELLATREDRRPGGPNDWLISRQNIDRRSPLVRKVFDVTSNPRVNTVLHVARGVSAAFLLAPTSRWRRSRLAANAIATGASLGTFPGQIYGTDGSDQASFLVQATAAVARSSRQPRVVDAALWFLALQSTLNYAASGWVKMTSPTWRSGRALPGVMRTVTYGHQGAWRATQRFPRSARVLAHGVLGMECLFPAVFVAGGRLAPAFLGSAAAFHLANAGVMGLGRFVGAFCAMHPAVLYATDPRRRFGPGPRRSDALPAVVGGIAAAALAVGAAATARRRHVLDQELRHRRSIVTRSGNRLSYLASNLDADGPVIFFESALAATDQHWDWIRPRLSGDFATVVYQRAGYGVSQYHGGRAFALSDAVDDFTDLVAAVTRNRPVVIVGHALGGYLALRSAEALGDRVRGVVLINASHPAELDRSPRQAAGAQMLDTTLRFMAPSMRLGLGPLLQTPRALDRLPASARRAAETQYRDERLWSAAHREWKGVRREFGGFEGQLPKVDADMLVLTAAETLADDPVQADLHRELGEAGSSATSILVEGADHDTVITGRDNAERVAGHVRTFVLGLRR